MAYLMVLNKIQMSVTSMQQPGKKRKRVSEQFVQKVKKKAYTEDIDGVHFTYSILRKQNNSYTAYNERFLILKGNQSIGYARALPEATLLPFYDTENIPKLKKEIYLNQINNIVTDEQQLIINFAPELKLQRWQFECNSKGSALEWKMIITNSIQQGKLINSNRPIQVNLPDNKQPNFNKANTANQNNTFPSTPLKNVQQNMVSPSSFNNNINNQQQNMNYSHSQQNFVHQGQSQQNSINHSHSEHHLMNTQGYNQSYNNNQPINNSPTQVVHQNIQPNASLIPVNQPISSQVSNQLYNQQSSSSLHANIALREQYLRKRKDQQRIRGEVNVQVYAHNPVSNSPTKSSEQKIMGSNWDYQFLKGESEYLIVERFKLYCQEIIVMIINELALQQRKRRFKPTEENASYLTYEIERITIHIALLQLHETNNLQDRTTIISNNKIKRFKNQFKNSNYILQITKNKGRFRVPLMMVTQYKGLTALAKAKIHFTNDYSSIQHMLQQDIKQLERDTKISRTIFQDEDNVKAITADEKIFQKFNRSENKSKKFDFCFLININHYLPQDFYAYNKDSSNSHKLRAELLQDEDYDNLLFNGSNLNLVLSRVKVPTQARDAINILSQVSKTIPDRALFMIQSIESLDEVITNSLELSNLMHSNGINMRYLGFVHDNAKETWLKKIVLSEIVARSVKYFLRYDLQESLVNMNSNSLEEALEYQISQVLAWFNRIFGIGPESDSIWRQIFKQAQVNFKCSVSRQNIHIGFLIQALQYHGKLRLKNITFREPFFKANKIFSRNHFNNFLLTSKCYDLAFTEHYALIKSKIDNLTLSSYQQISSILNINKHQALDSHFRINNMHEKIILFLINWLPPQFAPYLYAINYQDIPTKLFYDLQITAIKWQLKSGRIVQAERIRDMVVEHVNKWLGQSYPVLSELYEIFARFYLNFRQEEKNSISYCRSMLKNEEKLLGTQHVKLADGYYQLGDIYLNYGKQVDALQSYKKALQILNLNNIHGTQALIQINIKVSQMYLANNTISQALTSAYQSMQLSRALDHSALFLLSAQVIGRCFDVQQNWIEYLKFVNQITIVIPAYKDNPLYLERVLKVMLYPIFHSIAVKSRECSKILKWIVQEFHERNGLNQISYEFLKAKIQEKAFPSMFFSFLENIETILREVEGSGLMNRWKGFQNMGINARSGRTEQMVAYLQAMHIFLSGNFIEGIFDSED